MTKENYNEIIDFAINKEKEAVAFYQDLQTRAKFAAQKEMFNEFENMERGHITILENIRNKGFSNLEQKEVKDLKISDYIVEIEPSDNMNYQDIIIMAMKKEAAAKNLYNNLASNFAGTDAELMFKRLAVEEAMHKLQFEKLYDDEILKDN